VKTRETLPPGYVNVGNSNDPTQGLEYVVGLAVPVTVENEVALLATIRYLVFDDALVNNLFLGNSKTGNMYFQEGENSTLVDYYPSSGDVTAPVASINGTVTAVESDTWGGVKSLYR